MEDAGWEARLEWDGGLVGPEMSGELAAQWREQADHCGDTTGYYDPKLTRAQVLALYEQELEEADCLRALDLPVDDPPSEQAYIDAHGTADQYYAHASIDFSVLGIEQMKETIAACPPPTWFLDVPGL